MVELFIMEYWEEDFLLDQLLLYIPVYYKQK